MIASLLTTRVNVLIVFLGAGAVIALIKISSLILPAAYYFNFSKLVAGESEPFLVDPPSVTGQKLCAIMARQRIPNEVFLRTIDCSAEYAASPSRSRPSRSLILSAQQLDEVYAIALQSERKVREQAVALLKSIQLKVLSDAEVEQRIATQPNSRLAFESLIAHYRSQLDSTRQELRQLTSGLFISIDVKDTDRYLTGSDAEFTSPSVPALSDGAIADIIRAHRLFFSLRSNIEWRNYLMPMRKSSVDQFISQSYTPLDIGRRIADFYIGNASKWLTTTMQDYFERSGVNISTVEEERRAIYFEIIRFSHFQYLLAILGRIAPVLMFGVAIGMMVGRSEWFSISLAAGLAAFLLSWPLMLMWERLVHSRWVDSYELFMSLYLLYICAFFFTGRSGALIGAWVRERAICGSMDETAPLTWQKLTLNVAGAIALNGLVYFSNMAIPLASWSGNQP